MPEREFFRALDVLLDTGAYAAARPYFQLGARNAARRSDALTLRRWLDRVPEAERHAPEWQEAQLWVAYRAGDRALALEVTGRRPGAFPAFEAFVAAWTQPWETVLERARVALGQPSPQPQPGPVGEAGPGESGPGDWVAARFRAVALAELGREGWEAAFAEAAAWTQPERDRGLLFMEWAHQLVSRGQEARARDAWAQAVTHLKGDPWAVTQALSNLGITCLRLDDLPAAERAFARAVALSGGPHTRGQLSVAWRGLGGLYLWNGQLDRAEHAYRMAEEKADDVALTVMARRGLARLLRLRGHLDEAAEVLRSALLHARVQDGAQHAVFADLAALHLLLGDPDAARASLERAHPAEVMDGWRMQIVRAGLARQAGDPDWAALLRGLPLSHHLIREEARVFPELLGAVGVHDTVPEWRIDVNLDGPVQVRTASGPIHVQGTEASLLALLAVHGGSVAVERALEALHLPGADMRQRKRQLNKVVGRLREHLGWPGAVTHDRALVALSRAPHWHVSTPQHPARLDLFCEGLHDPWVNEYRSDRQMRMFLEPVEPG